MGGWVAGSIETKAISASNLRLKLKLTEAKLGNISYGISFPLDFEIFQGFILLSFEAHIHSS